jgi:periplasmic divalent cation tolerance protein
MPPADGPLIVLTTVPSPDVAEAIARRLVEARLAACVNVLPPVKSYYSWRGALESADEFLLVIKTRESRYERLEQALKALHPYELPEIVAVPIVKGLAAYLTWIEQMTTESP